MVVDRGATISRIVDVVKSNLTYFEGTHMKVLFDLHTKSVSIEGDGPEVVQLLELVRDIAPKLPQITINTSPTNGEQPKREEIKPAINNGDGGNGGETLRQFCRKLSLASNSERIAAIGYFKKHHEQVASFTPKEIGQWFTICGFQKPSQMSVAVFDARKRRGYVDTAGQGSWKLTTEGENLVIGKLNNEENED